MVLLMRAVMVTGSVIIDGVLLTEPDRTVMAKTDRFLAGASLRTFIAEHS